MNHPALSAYLLKRSARDDINQSEKELNSVWCKVKILKSFSNNNLENYLLRIIVSMQLLIERFLSLVFDLWYRFSIDQIRLQISIVFL